MSAVIEIAADGLPKDVRVLAARGNEGINEIARWEVTILTSETLDADKLVGTPCTIRVRDDFESIGRTIALLFAHVSRGEDAKSDHRFHLELASPAWLLTRRSGYRVFQDKTTKEIVLEILSEAGFDASQIVQRISGSYDKRIYCTQYAETEWDFIKRLLAEEGISLWFDMIDDAPKIVLADDKSAYEGILGEVVVPYVDPSETMQPRCISEMSVTHAIGYEATALRDYDVRAPEVFIEGKAGSGPREHFEYPCKTLTSKGAAARAQVRLEQLQRHDVTVRVTTDCGRLQPGRVVNIEGVADAWLNGPYIVVTLEHRVALGDAFGSTSSGYRAKAMLVPHGKVAYRPDMPPKRALHGTEPATTTGASGEEIHVDDLGRVKVRFPWDRSGVTDDKSSCWVRCLQMGLGGSMLLPRVGWEVPIAYQDGDPDRPFVLGRIYNGRQVVPYGLPGGSATTTLQSATSPGGGSTNEIRMGDGAGGQEFFLHASKDQTVAVGGSSTTSVSANETHDVGLGLVGKIDASQSLSVGGSQSVNVGTDYGIAAAGSRTEMVAAMEAQKITANRIVNVGGTYLELIGAMYGIQCNQSNTGVVGAFTQLVGGAMAVAGGLGVTETTLAARTELVAGGKSLLAASGASESVLGIKSITAGSTNEKAGANVSMSCKAAGSVKVGGTTSITAGGPIIVEAASISITAASMKHSAFEVGGGKLTIKQGTTKVKGTIKREGGGLIG